MKLDKQFLSIVLLLIIGLGSVSSTSMTIKTFRRRSHNNSRRVSAKITTGGVVTKIFHEIEKFIKDPKNIAYFIMGIVSEFFPGVEKLYNLIKDSLDWYEECTGTITAAWNLLKNKTPSTDEEREKNEIDNAVKEIEKDDKNKDEEKKKFCIESKKILEKVYKKAVKDLIKNKNDINQKIEDSKTEPKDVYCAYPLTSENAKEKIIDKFGSEDNFKDLCLQLREVTDCAKFKPDTSAVWRFAKSTFDYALFANDAYECLSTTLKVGGKSKNEEIKKLANTVFGTWAKIKFICKQCVSTVAHILSGGIWGVVRAAFIVLSLGFKLYLMSLEFIGNLPFKVGQLVGKGIKIIKTLAAGRRRRK
jgi:hypothetical protein